MGLETATFIDDLVVTNPLSSDAKKQGDDHLRLIKAVLKNSIKNVTRAFYTPSAITKTGNYTVLSTDDNMTIVCDTTSAFTLTLPSLVSGDKGWGIWVLKTTTDANPVFIAPPSGTINGYTKVRRSVPFQPTRVTWTGTAFYAERANGSPVGTVIPYYGTTLPPGHLWPDGTTFTAADFVELNVVLGGNTKPDIRGRVEAGKDDMGGVDAGRLDFDFDGTILGEVGGSDAHALIEPELGAHSHDAFIGDDPQAHEVPALNVGTFVGYQSGGGLGAVISVAYTTIGATQTSTEPLKIRSTAGTATGADNSTANAGDGAAHDNMQPTIIANKILVAE